MCRFLSPAVRFQDLISPRVTHCTRGELHVERNLVRHQLFLGIEHHFLGDLLAGVGSGAGHDGCEGGIDHAVTRIERFAIANGGVHFIVLGLVTVVAAFAIGSGIPAPHEAVLLVGKNMELAARFTGVLAFGTINAVPHTVLTVIHLAGEVVALGAIGPGELHTEVIKDIAFLFTPIWRPPLATT